MPQTISDLLDVSKESIEKHGAFDAVLDFDSSLFIHPTLVKSSSAPELQDAYIKIYKHFEKIMKLLTTSKQKGDRLWREAEKLLTFPEFKGLCIGYAKKRGTYGSGMGPVLRAQLLQSAKEIIAAGITDPELFELVGLFEKDIGCDRISDMLGRIIASDLYQYSTRIYSELGIKGEKIKYGGKEYELPINPHNQTPIVLIPQDILDDLPVAHSWEDIDRLCSKNSELRLKLNQIVGSSWKKKVTKKQLKDLFVRHPDILREFLKAHKKSKQKPYDFEADPLGKVKWLDIGKAFSRDYPLAFSLQSLKTLNDVDKVVSEICAKFKEHVEVHGLWKNLYNPSTGRPFHEHFAQRIFFTIADVYCATSNLDLSPSSDGGRGPVDFKISSGYDARVLVEVKLSTNKDLIHGFEKQLPEYQKAEKTKKGKFLVLDFGTTPKRLENLFKNKNKHSSNRNLPEIIVIDARKKASASKF